MREDQRRFAPAATRNREAICQALKNEWPAQGKVLEIASGSGEHAVFLARHAPHLQFQPSDPDPEARASIEAWQVHEGLESVAPPLSIDVREPDWADSISQFEALLCINMIHIAPWSASEGLFKGSKAVKAGNKGIDDEEEALSAAMKKQRRPAQDVYELADSFRRRFDDEEEEGSGSDGGSGSENESSSGDSDDSDSDMDMIIEDPDAWKFDWDILCRDCAKGRREAILQKSFLQKSSAAS